MKRHIFLIFSIISAIFIDIRAEQYYYFDHVTTTDGLQSNTIYCTLQDRNGFMWVGTRDGLSRYDGNSFRKMGDLAKGEGIGGNVFSIGEDVEGKIWFSTPRGIHIYDPDTDQINSIGMLGEKSCFTIQTDVKGKVWVLTDKLFRFDCRVLKDMSTVWKLLPA